MCYLLILTIKFRRHTINEVSAEIDFTAIEAVLNERYERVAGILSLSPNSPDKRGRNQFELAADELERHRPDWENLDSSVRVGDAVEIPAGIPVGIAPFGGYITTQIISGGVLTGTDHLIGGAGYMEQSHRRKNALLRVAVPLGEGKGTIDLLVPSWRRLADDAHATYTSVLQKPLVNSPIALV